MALPTYCLSDRTETLEELSGMIVNRCALVTGLGIEIIQRGIVPESKDSGDLSRLIQKVRRPDCGR